MAWQNTTLCFNVSGTWVKQSL